MVVFLDVLVAWLFLRCFSSVVVVVGFQVGWLLFLSGSTV